MPKKLFQSFIDLSRLFVFIIICKQIVFFDISWELFSFDFIKGTPKKVCKLSHSFLDYVLYAKSFTILFRYFNVTNNYNITSTHFNILNCIPGTLEILEIQFLPDSRV